MLIFKDYPALLSEIWSNLEKISVTLVRSQPVNQLGLDFGIRRNISQGLKVNFFKSIFYKKLKIQFHIDCEEVMKRKQTGRNERQQSGKGLRQKNDITPVGGRLGQQVEQLIGSNKLLDINFLQQKFSQQKRILQKQCGRLEQKLLKQINLNEQRRFEYEKKQQRYISEIEMLENQKEALKNKLQLQLQQQKDPDSFYTHQQQHLNNQEQQQRQKEHLTKYKQLILKYKQLQQDYHQLQEALILEDQQKQQLKLQNQELTQHNENIKIRVLKDQVEFNKVKDLLQTYTNEKHLINQQFQQYADRITRLQEELTTTKEKLVDQKKKKKQTQKQLHSIQEKLSVFQNQSILKYQQRINQAVKQTELQKEKYIQLNTKLSFTEIALQKKDAYLKEVQSLLREVREEKEVLQEKCQKQEKQLSEQRDQLMRVNNSRQQMKEEFEEEKAALVKKHNDEMGAIKKKTIEEMYPILRDKNQERSKKNLQNYLKNYKSSGNFLRMPFNLIEPYSSEQNGYYSSEQNGQELDRNQNPIQRFKLQSQINSLQMQKLNMKKQQDLLSSQMTKLKTQCTQLRSQLDMKIRQCQQLSLKIDKMQHTKSSQMVSLRKQVAQLKSKQTQVLEMIRDRQQYEQAMNLKIIFYDKKIKQLLETIDRKQTIIDKVKTQKAQLEEKNKFYQDKIQKLTDDIDNLKRTKNDLSRKDQLMRDYRTRYQKAKAEQDHFRQAIQTLRKDKQKLQNALDSKEEYITSLKKKQIKDLQQIQKTTQDKIKSTENKLNKNIKENYEVKIKKLKKDLDATSQALYSIKTILTDMVQKHVTKSSKTKHNQSHSQFQNYQAAKLLGLNANQIDSFLNPSKAMDQGILDQLEHLWSEEDFSNFTKQSLNYILSKSQ